MLPFDPRRTPSLLFSGVLALLFGCDARAHTQTPRHEQSDPAGVRGASLLEPEGLGAAKLAIDDALGPSVRTLELRAHADRWLLQAEDPQRPGRLVQLEYRNGHLGRPLEMTLRGSGALEQNLFSLSEVDFDRIPALIDRARRSVDPEDGVVDHVLVRRGLPFEVEVRLRVFVDSPRRDGYLDADRSGRPIE